MDKKELRQKIEVFIDHIIPYLVVILLILIILELAFNEQVKPYEKYILAMDYSVIGVFCVDLFFKYLKVRKIPEFLKHYWLDLIAIFPFFLFFRIFEQMYQLAILPQLFKEPQALLHESVVLEREGLRLIRAAEETGKASRTRILLRFIRPIQRLPRLLKIIPYFERPTKEHHKAIEEIRKEKLRKK